MTPEQLDEIKRAAESDDTIPNKTARDILALLAEVERLQGELRFREHQVTELQAELAAAQTLIPIAEQLPVPLKSVLCFCDNYFTVGCRDLVGNWYEIDGPKIAVTHWQHLSEPPKE